MRFEDDPPMLSVLLFLTAYYNTVLLISSSRVIFMNNLPYGSKMAFDFFCFFVIDNHSLLKSEEHSSIFSGRIRRRFIRLIPSLYFLLKDDIMLIARHHINGDLHGE